MFCKKCGKSLPDDAKFCPCCGTAAEQSVSSFGNGVTPLNGNAPQAKPYNPKSEGLLSLSVTGLICAVVSLIAAFADFSYIMIISLGQGFYITPGLVIGLFFVALTLVIALVCSIMGMRSCIAVRRVPGIVLGAVGIGISAFALIYFIFDMVIATEII